MSSVACFVGFASCKTFGKQPKRPCFGAKPPYRSSAICATASCSGFVRLTASILAWSRGGSPSNIAPARMPGVYAQGLCTMQSQPSIHSLSPRGKGFGVRDREFALSYKIQTFSTNLRHRISGAFVVIIDLFILSSSALKLCKAQGMILLYHSMYHEDLCRIRRA